MKLRQVTIFETIKAVRVTTAEVPADWDKERIMKEFDENPEFNTVDSDILLDDEERISVDNIEFSEAYES